MRIRDFALATIAVSTGVLAGCGDDGGPAAPSDLFGQYTLQTVNGESLPFEVQQPTGSEILLGSVTLKLGSAYDLLLEYRDKVGTSTYDESGAWSLFAADSIFFGPGGEAATYRGRLAGGVLTTVTPDGLILRFAR